MVFLWFSYGFPRKSPQKMFRLPRSGATPEDYAALTPAQQAAIMEGAMNGDSGVLDVGVDGLIIGRLNGGNLGGFMVKIWVGL